MSFLRGLFGGRSAQARKALDEGRLDDAEALLKALIDDGTAGPGEWWNLGLVYKFQKRWQESLDAFVRNGELRPAPEAYWNAGVAATALRNWTVARWAWQRLEFDVGPGEGAPETDFGPSPVRLNPDGDGEVVWGTRIDPCRMRIESIPLPSSGHRWRDVVLHDVVPRGTRRLGEHEFSVFDELERMDPSPFETLQADLRWARPEDDEELNELLADRDLGGENWTSSITMLCAKCSLSNAHDHGDDPAEVRLTGTWGFGGDAEAIRSALAHWSGAGSGRQAASLEPATGPADWPGSAAPTP